MAFTSEHSVCTGKVSYSMLTSKRLGKYLVGEVDPQEKDDPEGGKAQKADEQGQVEVGEAARPPVCVWERESARDVRATEEAENRGRCASPVLRA